MATMIAQALVLVLGWVAGWMWPREQRVGRFTKETWVNLLNGGILFGGKQAVVLGAAAAGYQASASRLVDLSGQHPLVQFLVAFLALDLVRYWVHYADHRVKFLWKFHRVHHSAEHLDASTGFRMHVVDFLQLAAIPATLFGLVFRFSDGWILPAALTIGIVADAMEHANVRFPLDTWWRRAWYQVFNNPLFHSWHHTREGQIYDGCYANALPLWDRLFGTDVSRPIPPDEYGIEDKQCIVADDLVGMQLLRPGERQVAWSRRQAG